MYSNMGESKWISKKSTVPSLNFGVIFQLRSAAKNKQAKWIKMQWQRFSVPYPLLDIFGNKKQPKNKQTKTPNIAIRSKYFPNRKKWNMRTDRGHFAKIKGIMKAILFCTLYT